MTLSQEQNNGWRCWWHDPRPGKPDGKKPRRFQDFVTREEADAEKVRRQAAGYASCVTQIVAGAHTHLMTSYERTRAYGPGYRK